MILVACCLSVEHAQLMVRVFREAGVDARAAWADSSMQERRGALGDPLGKSVSDTRRWGDRASLSASCGVRLDGAALRSGKEPAYECLARGVESLLRQGFFEGDPLQAFDDVHAAFGAKSSAHLLVALSQ